MYRYMVFATIECFLFRRMPAICSGDLCLMSSHLMNRRIDPLMIRIESIAAIRSIRFILRTSLTSYSSRPPNSLMCRTTELWSLPIVRAISLTEYPLLSILEIQGQSVFPMCVCDISVHLIDMNRSMYHYRGGAISLQTVVHLACEFRNNTLT